MNSAPCIGTKHCDASMLDFRSTHCVKYVDQTSVRQLRVKRVRNSQIQSRAVDSADEWPTDAELAAAEEVAQAAAAETADNEDSAQIECQESAPGISLSPVHPLQRQRVLSTPSPLQDPAAFVWSMALLVTIRLSRRWSEMAPFSVASQDISEEALINDQQLFSSRQAYERQVSAARAAEADERLVKARNDAAAREAERQTRMRERAETKAAAKARADEVAAAQRAKFEEAEAASATLLAEKTAIAQKEREDRERLRQQELEAARREAEEQQRMAALAAKAEEERKQQEVAAAAAAEESERQRLRSLSQRFVLRLEGSISITRPPKGTMTSGRFPAPALLQLSAAFGSTLGGQSGTTSAAFASIPTAHEGIIAVIGAAAGAAANDFASALRLQALAGSGPLQVMDEGELQLWVHVATMRTIAVARKQLETLVNESSDRINDRTEVIKVGTERFVLPREEMQRLSLRYDAAVAALHDGRTSDASVLLESLAEDEERSFYQDLPKATVPHLGAALALASFVDKAFDEHPSIAAAATSLATSLLTTRTAAAPLDSLASFAAFLEASLPESHPITIAGHELADKNMSPATRREKKNRQLAEEATLAEALVQEEWPDASESAAARAAQREAATPIPERVWALRNVAATSALGGPAGAARAVQLLQQAVKLKEDDLGDSYHPCLLPELDAMAQAAAAAGPDLGDTETEARERALRILSYVAARYKATGNVGSGVVLLQAAIRYHEERLERRHRGISALESTADRWLETLTGDTRAQVIAKRSDNTTVPSITAAFTDELAAQASLGSQQSKAQQWQVGGIAPLKPLIETEASTEDTPSS